MRRVRLKHFEKHQNSREYFRTILAVDFVDVMEGNHTCHSPPVLQYRRGRA